jgi:hypothetical protein
MKIIFNIFFLFSLILLSAILISSCEGSLEPTPKESIPDNSAYIKGTITFKGGLDSWPSKSNTFSSGTITIDSAYVLTVAAFTSENPKNILIEYLNGNLFFSDSLPLYSEKIEYTFPIPKTPTELKFIAVAMQTSDNLLDQIALSIYSEILGDTIPKFIYLEESSTVSGIDFLVDFHNLPTQTFK